MLFNSYVFILAFLPVVLGLYYLGIALGRPTLSRLTLLCSSVFFYAYWDVRYLPLLLASIIFNYAIGALILSRPQQQKKACLIFGLACNLLLLFFFKYCTFALSVVEDAFGFTVAFPQVSLPLGISFFTFTQIAFLVDAYKQKVEELTPASYGLFVTVFPHLIAGPILHHREMMSQFRDSQTYRWNADSCATGVFLFTLGLSKKIILADRLAPLVTRVFDATVIAPTLLDAWGGALAYTLQLYFDFSAYSDMAVGLGMLFNVRLPINFDSPYKSKSIIEFWRRWHMTLSAFLREYLYIPLGGSRHGQAVKFLSLFLTMLLGGLWHGAGWTFILWGALHGGYLMINHFCKDRLSLPSALSWPLTLLAVIIGWVIFRASDLDQAFALLKGMAGQNGLIIPKSSAKWMANHIPFINADSILAVAGKTLLNRHELRMVLVLLLAVLVLPNSNQLEKKFQPGLAWGVVVALLLIYCILNLDGVSEFLYYQF